MRKKGLLMVPVVALAIVLGLSVPIQNVFATEDTNDIGTEEEAEVETEPPIPDSYYLPIESNEIENWPAGPQVEAEAAVVMDAATGAFLYSKNMDAKEYPASITKIMTTLVAIENGDLDSRVKFSDEAVNYLDPESSRLWMEEGERISLRRALYGVMLASANDCANGVAEKVGGSIDNFIQMMNDKAKELGCTNTHFTNAHGLHDEDHYTTARDMALIMQAALRNETFAEICQTVEYHYPKTNKMKEERYFINHHKMLPDGEFYYRGCLGGKTGFTSDSLNTLVTAVNRRGRVLICVVLRTNGSDKTYRETTQLLDYGFDNFTRERLPVAEAETTRAELLGISEIGMSSKITGPELHEKVIQTASTVRVSLPKEANAEEVDKTLTGDGTLAYTYKGWPVASIPVTFTPISFEVTKPQISELTAAALQRREEQLRAAAQETETEADSLVAGVGGGIQKGLQAANDFIYEHDIALAVVGLVLIIAMIPILLIAYVRSRKSTKIRKLRKQEKEELTQIEKDINSKSAFEIEAEIRAELEKERIAREKEEARKREIEAEEQRIREMEEVIARSEQPTEASKQEEPNQKED